MCVTLYKVSSAGRVHNTLYFNCRYLVLDIADNPIENIIRFFPMVSVELLQSCLCDVYDPVNAAAAGSPPRFSLARIRNSLIPKVVPATTPGLCDTGSLFPGLISRETFRVGKSVRVMCHNLHTLRAQSCFPISAIHFNVFCASNMFILVNWPGLAP